MIQPRNRGAVSRAIPRDSPWRRVGSVMVVTANVAIISLVLKQFVGTSTDASLYTVWAPLAIVLGLAATWTGRGILTWTSQPAPLGIVWGCGRCGRSSLQALTRVRPGRPPAWVGARCAGCGTTYRRVEGRIVAFPPAASPGPIDDPGIRFDDETGHPDEVRFVDESPG